MNITKSVIELRGKLIKCINTSGLPPVVVGLVLDGIRHEVEMLTAADMRKEDTEHADRADETEHAE